MMAVLKGTLVSVVLWGGVVLGLAPQPHAPAPLPRLIEQFLSSEVRPSSGERKQLLEGEPIAKLLEGDASREVGVFGAIWINASRSRYLEALRNIETFERGTSFPITRRISNPPRPEDFADMRLPERDVRDLEDCRVGDCEVKLDETTIEALRARVDWTKPTARADADRVFQRFAYNYVRAYNEAGNQRLAVYRDRSRPLHVAPELEAIIERVPAVSDLVPEVRQYLLNFPADRPPQSSDFLYWQETQFGLKPTIRLSHVIVREGDHETVVASKMLYASHYFWTGLEFRVLVPDPARGSGFWFITVNRSRSDGLSGLIGLFVRGRVRGKVRDGLLSALKATKTKLEAVHTSRP